MYPKQIELLTKTPTYTAYEKERDRNQNGEGGSFHDTKNLSTAQYIASCLGVWFDNQLSISRWE